MKLYVIDGLAWLGNRRTRAGTRGRLPNSCHAEPGPSCPDGRAGRGLGGQWALSVPALVLPVEPLRANAVEAPLTATGLQDIRLRSVDTLSGGQRQRVWLALALAQSTPVLLLEEPITFLDIGHQLEVRDLLRELNARDGRTVVMVLHDLGLAARYADYVVAMRAARSWPPVPRPASSPKHSCKTYSTSR